MHQALFCKHDTCRIYTCRTCPVRLLFLLADTSWLACALLARCTHAPADVANKRAAPALPASNISEEDDAGTIIVGVHAYQVRPTLRLSQNTAPALYNTQQLPDAPAVSTDDLTPYATLYVDGAEPATDDEDAAGPSNYERLMLSGPPVSSPGTCVSEFQYCGTHQP